ncbi:MAG TPA: ABC transporter permease [Methanocella sp.]|nr:ABC transporter permease [Methanocella sp.]
MPRMAARLFTDVRYGLLLFFRNRQAMFFAFVFPALFLLAVGYLLGGESDRSRIDYLLPGIIGMCILFSAISGTTGAMVKYRANGVYRKLATTPLTGFERNVSQMASGLVVVGLSAAVSLLMAWLVFGAAPDINPVSVLVVIAGAVTFVCLGMVVAYLVDDADSLNAITYVVIIPLVLLSGSLFPVERLPHLLRFVSVLSPLTYLNAGLRSAMFGGNYGDALLYTAICSFLCVVLFCVGVAILMGKEE